MMPAASNGVCSVAFGLFSYLKQSIQSLNLNTLIKPNPCYDKTEVKNSTTLRRCSEVFLLSVNRPLSMTFAD
ncbi:MAG: hypothetical protein ACJAYF_002135 [Arenicella sp.]|jgi:hypothetical protein